MIGQRFGHYEILEKIGAGGMGEVYRARDSRLDRDVAIKVLPESLAGDSDRLARFEREAKLLASLNHANIASIHGLEDANSIRFLVLELVDGEDLSERIARGPLAVSETLMIARQIAEALEEAHGQGVIHRDLKPANIKITPDGKVKLLDFGLAKAMDAAPDGSGQELSQSPTIMSGATQHGVILGTAAYMSPEQARGKAVDYRTDIWAFGCVLYEMVTGRACYTGETITDILTGILHREPDVEGLPDLPPAMRRVIERCLRKDLRQRIQHIGDARIEIDDALAGGSDAPVVSVAARTERRWLGWAIAGALGAVAGIVATMTLFGPRGPDESPRVRFAVPAPVGITTVVNPTLSPNARWLAYFTNEGVRIHDLERDESLTLPSLQEADRFVLFSPNSDWIGFRSGGKLRKIRVTGGVPVDLVDIGGHPGAAWGSRKTIIYAGTWTSGLFEIPEDGGDPRQVTTLDREQGETGHWAPSFLPDGRHVLFTVFTTRGSLKHARMDLLDLDSGERVPLGVGAYPVYLRSGHIVYHRSGLYEVAPFDLAQKKFTGPPKVVMEDVPYVSPAGNTVRYFSVSDNGVMAFISMDGFAGGRNSFYQLDRSGALGQLPLKPALYDAFEISPDGTRMASGVYEAGENDVWVFDLERGTGRRVTRDSNNFNPSWHPDGRQIAFTSTRLGTFDVFGLDVDTGDPPTPLLTADQDAFPLCWTPGGALIAGMSTADQGDNIVIVEEGDVTDLIASDAFEGGARVSLDGQWIAYISGRTGRNEIYVRPLGSGGDVTQVSSGGGGAPRWSTTSDDLFFVTGSTVGTIMMVRYEVRSGKFVARQPVPYLSDLPEGSAVDGKRRIAPTAVFVSYAVSANGQLIISLPETDPIPRVHVILDGFGELQRQAAAER